MGPIYFSPLSSMWPEDLTFSGLRVVFSVLSYFRYFFVLCPSLGGYPLTTDGESRTRTDVGRC